jgi:mannosyltransferase
MHQRMLILAVFSVIVRHYRGISIIVGLSLLFNISHNIYSFHIGRPTTPLDEPFNIGCQEPNINAPRENATILMLARNADIDGAVSSLQSLEEQFNRWFHYPVVFLNDQAFDQVFVDAVTEVVSGSVRFGVIAESMWQYPDRIDREKARTLMAFQAQSRVLYGGNESYHHMCRFYSG